MNNKGIKLALTGVMVMFAAFYSIYTAARYFYSPYNTEAVYQYTISDSIRAKGMLIREEQLLNAAYSGQTLGYVCEDGEVIIPGTVVAQGYQNPDELRQKNLADRCDSEINLLKKAANQSGGVQSPEIITAKINEAIGEVVNGVAAGDLEKLTESREQLQYYLGKRQTAGGAADFSQRVGYLTTKRDEALAKITQNETISSPIGGYFCSVTDGYEGLLSPQNMETLSIDDYKKLINGAQKPTPPTQQVGRAMKGHYWYFATVIPINDATSYQLKDKVILDFGIKDCRQIPAQVYKISYEEDSNLAIIIFSCNRINEQLITLRHATVDILSKSYSGLKIRSGAIRYNDQTEGVYVIQGGSIVFKPITRVYSGENFVLCLQDDAADSTKLKLFDEVVIEGVDLYDGKVVN